MAEPREEADFLSASKTSMASWVEPMLEPSAMNLQPAATKALASSPETSFWVAHGKAMSIAPTWTHGLWPGKYSHLADWVVKDFSVEMISFKDLNWSFAAWTA